MNVIENIKERPAMHGSIRVSLLETTARERFFFFFWLSPFSADDGYQYDTKY